MSISKWSHWLGLVLAILCLPSCQRGPVIVGASGQVTLDGKPLPEGMVVFEPLDAKQGQIREAVVTNGAFTLPETQGVPAGMEFRVLIKGFRKTGRKYPAADPALAYDEVEQYLPGKYNAESSLRATFSPENDKNQFRFELSSR